MNTKFKKDVDAFNKALRDLTGNPLTLWELKQQVDDMVLKFGRERRVEIVECRTP